MTKSDDELHYDCMHRFIALANEMKNEGMSNKVVSASLMTASCVFTSYATQGNTGQLDEATMDTIAKGYRSQLALVQAQRAQAENKQEEEKIKDKVEQIVSFPEDD